MRRTVVLCIGNHFRRDDGVAFAVAERARDSLPPTVRVVELDGEPARLVDAWADADLAVAVDAGRSDAPAGTVRRIEVTDGGPLPATRPASSHAYSLGDAVKLGRALGRVPARFVLYAVEGLDFSDGPGLSEPVARAVPDVVARVVEDALASMDAAQASGAG
jgi:hydrogenase maturation protease